jgi:glycosyltransferase involved in cell wall biosynthesis
MTNVPKISIVTPSFNQGEFLAATIESVISQAGDFIIDYIVVDGGSTDDSVDIIKRYDALIRTAMVPVNYCGLTFRWVSERDRGQAEALAKGFRMAEGEIFAWLNSDDTYLPGALQTVAAFFGDYPETGLLYGDAHYCDTVGTVIGRYRTEVFDYDKLACFNYICQPSTFFRKKVFDAVGGLDNTLLFAMDYDLWVRIGKRFTCRYLPKFFSMYRLHESSKTIRDETLYKNCEESLAVTIHHFGWAPLTRVYTACSILCKARLPDMLARNRFAVAVAAMLCSFFRSLYLNRGFNCNDLKLLTGKNFSKLLKSRLEIMTSRNDENLSRKP